MLIPTSRLFLWFVRYALYAIFFLIRLNLILTFEFGPDDLDLSDLILSGGSMNKFKPVLAKQISTSSEKLESCSSLSNCSPPHLFPLWNLSKLRHCFKFLSLLRRLQQDKARIIFIFIRLMIFSEHHPLSTHCQITDTFSTQNWSQKMFESPWDVPSPRVKSDDLCGNRQETRPQTI